MADGPSTRDRIVAEARGLFAERGFDGATIGEIARRAGIAEGTIYRHFKDKKDLLMACVEPAVEEAYEASHAKLRGERDLRGFMRKVLEIRLKMYDRERDLFNILFTESLRHPEVADILLGEHMLERAKRNLPLFNSVVESGRLVRPLNFLIFSLGINAAMWAILNLGDKFCQGMKEHLGVECSTSNLLDDLTDFILYGIIGEPPAGQGNGGAQHG